MIVTVVVVDVLVVAFVLFYLILLSHEGSHPSLVLSAGDPKVYFIFLDHRFRVTLAYTA